MIPDTLADFVVPIGSVRRYPGNPRTHNLDVLRASLRRNGQYRPIVVNRRTMQVLAGNGTHEAAELEGWPEIAATMVDATPEEAARIVAVDNRASDLGGYDDGALLALLDGLPDLEGTGYDQDALAALQALADQAAGAPALTDPDAIPEPPAEPISRPGDLWLLGPHRLLCGDCRDLTAVERLLGGRRANIAFTSPPYAAQRDYDPDSGFQPIPPDEYADWFEDVQASIRAVLADDGSWFVNIKEHCEDGQRDLYVKDLTLAHVRRWGWRFVDELCWVRQGVPGRWPNRFKNGWEPVFHFSASERIKFDPEAVGHESDDVVAYSPDNPKTHSGFLSGSVKERFSGIALPTNVLKIGTAHSDPERGHTAEFPVALPTFFLKAYTVQGDVILDPFLGSGTTLIAAHDGGRVGYGVEISPRYVDVACRRYQEHTGTKPTLEATGEPHDFTSYPGGLNDAVR